MSNDLVYDFNGITSLSGSITAFVSQMNEHLAEVDRTFNNLLANGWSGAGADAFQGCSQKWHANADQMAQTLQTLSQKVGDAAVNMQQADAAAAARF
ncbi:WXG100 family type VII secretion target [Dactylosporangium sp. NPDC048998]|uniref:WXG100 family type VII secretion target n=1 Tax=Dactylosporangium sp. NPDC048998 TaxID=3363976 RepID=UPI003717F5BA